MLSLEIIKDFENCLEKYCPHVMPYYNKPLNSEQVNDYLVQLPVNLPEYEDLYRWKNGIDPEVQDYSVDIRIDFAGNFVTMQEAVSLYIENEQNEYWQNTLVPVLCNYEGETLLIETDQGSINYKKILFYSPSSSDLEPISYFDSVELMLITIIALFDEGAQQYDENSEMKIDFVLRKSICKRLNPFSEYWL